MQEDVYEFALKAKESALEGRSLQLPRRLTLRGIGIEGMASALTRQVEECVDSGDFTVIMCAGVASGRAFTR